MIRRRGRDADETSSDEDDAFTALSLKTNFKRNRVDADFVSTSLDDTAREKILKQGDSTAPSTSRVNEASKSKAVLPVALTSSMKRHHKPSDIRKAKMEALILELEEEKGKNKDGHTFIPEKKGSFVEPGEEKLTSNLFVGNLAPSITEEDLSRLFSQFGDLYSLKIMWPRTTEEKQRGRNTGFVCFVNREDAEDALESCNETDPFNVGRLLAMGWGKNVKKNVRRGTGGLDGLPSQYHEPEKSARRNESARSKFSKSGFHGVYDEFRPDGIPQVITLRDTALEDLSLAKSYDPSLHSVSAVRVELPRDPARFQFISTVASYVAKDGLDMEMRLIEEERGNPLFNFLTLVDADGKQQKENLFFRWRVYSFAQGDTYSSWRTDPFVMFHPNGRFWIPPPLDESVVNREKQRIKDGKEQPWSVPDHVKRSRNMSTGRQLERARSLRRRGRGQTRENSSTLKPAELLEFHKLVKKELTTSREKICRAMAFCFDKCLAAKQISELLKEAMLEETVLVTVDVKVARLFLLSDILFNSQQPGIRNAFMYRTTIESMAPEIFSGLGKYQARNIGRMTVNKLRKAVSAVLGAWTNWGVYNAAFMDELESHFHGRPIPIENGSSNEEPKVGLKKEGIQVPCTEVKVTESGREPSKAEDRFHTFAIDRGGSAFLSVNIEPIGPEFDSNTSCDVDGEPIDEADSLDGEELGDEIYDDVTHPRQQAES